ncbi:MAG: peptidase M64 [Bacteroidetes bacterium]|nr:peptidase M64 [Bacteroidota bacterium]
MLLKLQWLCAAGILLASAGNAQTFPVSNININGPDTNRINIVVLPDGFLSSQLDTFKDKVKSIQAYVFNASPYKEYAKFFNVYSIQVPSAEAGTTHPGTATDVTEPASPIESHNTYFRSTYDNGGVHRAVWAQNSSGVFSVLNANFPMYDVPMVLVNDPEYGGTGGNYITFSINSSANETAVHELGHTFGKLWDEYWNNMPGEHPNMTQDNSTVTNVWHKWIGTGSVGIYAHGTSGVEASWYRPHQNCKMRFLNVPLCAVCKENIIDRIYDKVNPIDAYIPANTGKIQSSATPLSFSFTPVKPNPNTLQYKWTLNGNTINTTDTNISINESQLNIGANTLIATVTDTTLMSRSYTPAKGYMFSVQWTIQRNWASTVSNIVADNRFSYSFYPVPAKNTVNLYCNNNTNATSLDYAITSITGSVVGSGKMSIAKGEQTLPINIGGLAAGTYNISLRGEGVVVDARIIIE